MSSTQEAGDIFGEGSGPAQAMLRSPTVLIASIGLWGMNVYFFQLFKIDYAYVLNLDLVKEREAQLRASSRISMEEIVEGGSKQSSKTSEMGDDDDYQDAVLGEEPVEYDGAAITWQKLIGFSVSLILLLHLSILFWIDILGGGSIGAVFAFYGAVAIFIVIPLPATRWLRSATVIVLQRAFELFNPRCSCASSDASRPRPIPFIDVFFADGMCSLSKVFFDWGWLFHLASHYPEPVPKSTHSILIPSFFAAVPYLIRARQCLVMLTVGRIKADPKRYQHFLNAVKYLTSIFPLCLSAYQQTIEPERAHEWEGVLIFLLSINACYALAWDIVMDWGMMSNPTAVIGCLDSVSPDDPSKAPSCGHAVLRPMLRFGTLASTLILVIDSVLRFSWMLRFQERIFPSKDHFVLTTQFLEVFRRAIWNLLRVEWEHIKQERATNARPRGGDVEVKPFLSAPISLKITPAHAQRKD